MGFKRSSDITKKYMAILSNKRTGRVYLMHFGARTYAQYKDSTGLGLYSKNDHLDNDRRRRYVARHKGFVKPGYYSPGYFSMKYLW